MTIYTFEALPIHPQPQPLESFCSYTMGLAMANGMETVSRWWLLCYPTSNPRISGLTGDATPISFGQLPELAACSEQTLQNTTFYHLVKKFGCATHPQPINTFLSGSVASHLRYCPQCLTEQNYYRLTWRFLTLSGCPKHGCELSHTCGHCERPLRLLPRIPKVGLCPHCGEQLGRCDSLPLDDQTWLKAKARERDLAYLLSPQPGQTSSEDLKKQLGKQFAYRRLSRQLKVTQVAHDLGCTVSKLHVLENPSDKTSCGKFSTYLDYADYLEVDLQTLFETPPPEGTYEDILANRLEQIITELTQAEQWVTRKELAQQLGLHESALWSYPKLKTLWSNFLARRRQVRYAGLVDQIRQIATQLEKEGLRVSGREISRRMGRDSSDMYQYPQTAAAMKEVAGPAAQARYATRREEQLLRQVKVATATLEARNERVSKTAISRETGVSFPTLDSCPRVKAYLDELLPLKTQEHWDKQRQQRDAEWLLRVQQGVETLQARDEPITILTICQIVNKSEHGLRANPGVDAFMKQAIENYRIQQRQQREADLLTLVQQAAETLQAKDQTVTIRAICQIIRKSENGLRTYPSVAAFFKQVVAANKRSRAEG